MSDLEWHEEGSFAAPRVEFDPQHNRLTIEGRLIPEDPELFFNRFFSWIDRYMASKVQSVEFNLFLYYYNTSSLKRMTILFGKLDEMLKNSRKKVVIIWRCDENDEDNIADGEDLKNMYSLDWRIEEIKTEN